MGGLRILVVDDDRDFAMSWGRVIESDGHEVELVFSGEEAVEKFAEADFDVAFVDVLLPGKNGVESLVEMRKLNPRAKVVMMTGFSVNELLDQAVEGGAWEVLHKPLDEERVFTMLDEIRPGGIVLVADDDPDFLAVIRQVLEETGYSVVAVRNGREALEAVESNHFEVLLLDLRMPVLDGLEVYLEVRKTGRTIPTIIATGYAREEALKLDRLRRLDVTGVLEKPFAPEDLLELIRSMSSR